MRDGLGMDNGGRTNKESRGVAAFVYYYLYSVQKGGRRWPSSPFKRDATQESMICHLGGEMNGLMRVFLWRQQSGHVISHG